MKVRSLLLILITIVTSLDSIAKDVETLSYKVVYRWGIVNKQAGRATFINEFDNDGICRAMMYARTEPWADSLYSVRDTLKSIYDSTTRLPYNYTRIAHEGGSYAHDQVIFSNNSNISSAYCVCLRRKKNESTTNRIETNLEANGPAVDLLSSFYYLRGLNFEKMQIGQSIVINIFSGKRKEILKITYTGLDSIKINNNEEKCHKIIFTFSSKSGKTTSSPIKAWLSTDAKCIPMKIEGELKIGKVQCILIN